MFELTSEAGYENMRHRGDKQKINRPGTGAKFHKRSYDNLTTIFGLTKSHDSCRIHKIFTTILEHILKQNVTITL